MTTQYLQLSQSTPSSRLFLSLARFSHATVSRASTGPIPWVHVSHPNLCALLDVYEVRNVAGATERHHRFKVLQDPEVIENIDLNVLATEARNAMVQTQAMQMVKQNPTVTVVVKAPCLAIRYPFSDGQVRRFQVRFTHDADFYEAMKIFTQANVPAFEAGGLPNQPYQSMQPTPTQYSSNANNFSVNGAASTGLGSLQQRPYTAGSVMQNQETQAWNSSGVTAMPLSGHANINLYVPRPSTAPTSTFQRTFDTLPPKRELPFPRRTRQNTVNSGVPEQSDADRQQQRPKPTLTEPETTEPVIKPVEVSENTAKGTKRVSTSRKASAPKKPRATTAPRKRTATRKVIENSCLLEDKRDSACGDAVGIAVGIVENIPKASETGTQLQLDETASRPTADLRDLEQQTTSTSAVQEPTDGLVAETTDAEALMNNQDMMPEHSTTAADQALQATKTAMAQADTTPAVPPEQGRNPPSLSLTDETDLAPSMPPATISTNHKNDNPKSERTQHVAVPAQSALSLLLSKADFAQPATKLADFDALTDQQKHEALETFICQQFDDENFVGLCKTIEGVWSRCFVRL